MNSINLGDGYWGYNECHKTHGLQFDAEHCCDDKYAKAYREWLKGCSCALDNPMECEECTIAFLKHIRGIKSET